jgi:hypothetical protein
MNHNENELTEDWMASKKRPLNCHTKTAESYPKSTKAIFKSLHQSTEAVKQIERALKIEKKNEKKSNNSMSIDRITDGC